MKTIVCDKCGKALTPTRPEWSNVAIKMPKKALTADLCESCCLGLEAWLTEPYPVAR